MHGQFRTALLTLASGAPVRIGFDRPQRKPWERSTRRLVPEAYVHGWTGAREGAWLAYTHRIPLPTPDVHAVDRYLWVGPLLGFDDGPPQFDVPIPSESVRNIETVLGDAGLGRKPFAVLVPGTVWETKHWRAEGFAEVGRHLARKGHGVVLAGSAGERKLCSEVATQCPGAVNLAGQTTLTELAALLRRAVFCVTNDSGSMHLAVALERPVVSIFGPTDPVWVGPYRRPRSVVQATVGCAPCYLRRLRDCPHEHACMRDVTAAEVVAKIDEVLASDARAAS
jgi:ADP-heptose:LPS heptosyltransferase